MPIRHQVIPSLLLAWIACGSSGVVQAELKVSPAAVELDRPECSAQILVLQKLPDARELDVTREVTYTVQPEGIVSISPRG
ncbi:MAG: hypothetical protein ACKVT0_14145, partial [Planctomycetaceae bacterium]